jgi:hypothetical protein
MEAIVASGIIGAYKFWPEHRAKWDIQVDLVSVGLGLLSLLTLTDLFETRASLLTRLHTRYEFGYYIGFLVTDPAQVGHHAMTLTLMFMAGPYKQFGSFVLFIFSLTNPCLDMYRHTKSSTWLVPFCTGFFAFRVVGGGILTRRLLYGAPESMPLNIYYACSILLSSIWVMQIYWFRKMVNKFARTLSPIRA